MADEDELRAWLEDNTVEAKAKIAYDIARSAHPGAPPRWLQKPWHQMPKAYREFLEEVARHAADPSS